MTLVNTLTSLSQLDYTYICMLLYTSQLVQSLHYSMKYMLYIIKMTYHAMLHLLASSITCTPALIEVECILQVQEQLPPLCKKYKSILKVTAYLLCITITKAHF